MGAWSTRPVVATVAVFPDVELVLTSLLRPLLQATHDVLVSNRQVATQRAFTVVVRDDGGQELQVTTTRRVGIRVLGPSDQAQATGDLARAVSTAVRSLPGLSPVVEARIQLSPVRVDEGTETRPEYYLTCEITLTGTPTRAPTLS